METTAPVNETQAAPAETTAAQTETTAQPAGTQAATDALPPTQSKPQDAPPAAQASVVTSPAAEVEVNVGGDPDKAPEKTPEPTAQSLRSDRFTFLRDAVEHATRGHAMALSAGEAHEHLAVAKSNLLTMGDQSYVDLLLTILDKIRNVQLPTSDQIQSWSTLAAEIYQLWRQFFAVAKPVDQELNDALHGLGNSIEAPSILGGLALRADQQGWSGNLDQNKLETILDGHQDKELLAVGVKPAQIVPLINAIGHAKAMLAAKVEHDKVSNATAG